ncbi:MAG: hypothetical protein CMQ40_07045 [Gammaproteobacteria bacterium]|nr:hypothetical protein [Gammaproteobacteria bacterium]
MCSQKKKNMKTRVSLIAIALLFSFPLPFISTSIAEEQISFLGRAFLITTSQSINDTVLHIINSSDKPQTFRGNLYNQDGDQLGPTDVILNPDPIISQARMKLTAQDLEILFSTAPWLGPAMLEVKASENFKLMSKLKSPSGLVSNTNCVREQVVQNIEPFNSDTLTYIRFINIGTEDITNIRGTMRNSEGSLIGSSDILLVDRLRPKQGVWLSGQKLLNRFGSAWGSVASLSLVESPDNLRLLNLNFVNGETFFNFSCFENQEEARIFLFTNSESNNTTEAHLINTGNNSLTFTANLYNSSGLQLGETDTRISNTDVSPGARLIINAKTLESAFDTLPWNGPALLEITSQGMFDLLTRLESPSGLISNTNCVRKNAVHNIEGFNSSTLTYIRLINVGSEEITGIRGTLHDKDGSILGTSETLLKEKLKAKEQVWISNRQLERIFEVSWIDEASLVVIADNNSDLRLLNLNFENSETFFNFSCYQSAAEIN